ncbi:unnamed protein product [Cylicostephanus goldi]|uniref:Uncharacterized protein n=1 Tax=Cylicostephanus goldi TaxID=71465 RepID=A0A3P6QQH6_CYLGO|nr:unnamed protein product [Cylicostephanus goldi]
MDYLHTGYRDGYRPLSMQMHAAGSFAGREEGHISSYHRRYYLHCDGEMNSRRNDAAFVFTLFIATVAMRRKQMYPACPCCENLNRWVLKSELNWKEFGFSSLTASKATSIPYQL